jgi:cytoskeletal protein CcmA (bactofilin family)
MADTLSAQDWMTPWEVWAFTQILNGDGADMAEVPKEARGETDTDKAPVIWPLLRDDEGIPLRDPDGRFQPADEAAWAEWQVLSARFLEHVATDRAFVEHRRRNRVRILSARCGESLDFAGGRLLGELWLDRCRLDEELNLQGAEIGGSLSLESSFLVAGLHADGLVTSGGVFLGGSARFDGGVRLPGASIGVLLDCKGSQFNAGEDGSSLNADRLDATGGVFLSGGARFDGEVRFLGAEIGGNLECDGSHFKAGADGDSLSADGLVIRGDVFLSGGACFDGSLRLVGAEIGGNLECEGSHFKASGNRKSLSAYRLVTKGSVFLRSGARFDGRVLLSGADIAGDLQLSDSKFDGEIDLSSARMTELLLDATSHGMNAPNWGEKASLDLTNAEIGALHGSLAAWQRDGKFIECKLDGLQVRRLSGMAGGQSLKDAEPEYIREWLRNDASFSPSAYLTVAKALKDEGESEKARSVLIALEDQRTLHMKWRSRSGLMKLFRLGWLGPVTGYGYSAARGVIILFVAILVFAWAGSVWHALHVTGGFSGTKLASPGEFLPWLGFSFETAFPLADLDPVDDTFLEDQFKVGVIEKLEQKDYDALPRGLRALFMGERVFGLAILATLIASLTGWAEQRGSGE